MTGKSYLGGMAGNLGNSRGFSRYSAGERGYHCINGIGYGSEKYFVGKRNNNFRGDVDSRASNFYRISELMRRDYVIFEPNSILQKPTGKQLVDKLVEEKYILHESPICGKCGGILGIGGRCSSCSYLSRDIRWQSPASRKAYKPLKP